jgi:tetratricopeptide (TPR) repeat protein
LGNALKELERLDEAEASYRQAITLKPDYAEAHYNLGAMLQEQDRFKEAEISYRKAITLKPDLA